MTDRTPVYLDHNATTPVADELKLEISRWIDAWGNPSSIHTAGRDPKALIRESRRDLAEFLGCHPLELVFTSGGSESNNAVLKSVWFERGKGRPHFLISSVEHPSVLRAADWLRAQGAEIDLIPVSRRGVLDMAFVESRLSPRTALISVMAANNELGSLFPIKALAEKAHSVGALMHTDAVQFFGKLPLNLSEWGVDYASFSGHKFYSLKGTGAVFIRKGAPWQSLIHGGGQERHRRGGTENTLGIAALGFLVRVRGPFVAQKAESIARLRDHFEARVLSEIPRVSLTAAESPRLPNTSSLVLDGVDGETLLMSLDLKGFAVSTGAACSSGSPEPSPVLLGVGLSRQEAQNSLRVSFGWDNRQQDIDEFVDVLKATVSRLRSLEAVAHG